MIFKKNNIKIIKNKILNNISWIKYGFSTKYNINGSGSNSFDLSFNNINFKENVLKNRKIFANTLKINYKKFVVGEQIHGTKIFLVTKKDIGKGSLSFENSIKGVDGLITAERNIPLFTLHADCAPIFLIDLDNKIIGLLHAGLKGTIGNIAGKAIKYMKKKFSTKPERVQVFIGPCIDKCCYNVNKNILKIIKNLSEDIYKLYTYKNYISLKKINEFFLKKEGVNKIEISNLCTKCNKNLFFSYRREKGITGRMAATIMIK